MLLSNVFIQPLSQTLFVYAAKQRNREDKIHFASFFSLNIFWAYVVLLVLSTAVVLAIIPPWFKFVPLMFSALIFDLLRTSPLQILNVERRQIEYGIWMALPSIIDFMVIGGALFYHATPFAFIAGLAGGRMLSCAFFCGYYLYKKEPVFFFRPDKEVFIRSEKGLRGFFAPFVVMALLGWVANYSSRYIISAWGDLTAVASFVALSGLVARPYTILGSCLTGYFRPILNHARTQADEERCKKVVVLWSVSAVGFGLMGGLAFYFVGNWLVNLLLSADYTSGCQTIILLLSVAQTVAICTHCLDNMIFSYGESRALMVPQIFSILMGTACVAYLSKYGAIGASLGRCALVVLNIVFTWVIYLKVKKANR